MTVEQFQAERRQVQDNAINELEPAVRDGLEQRDQGAPVEEWVTPVVAAAVAVYLARHESEAPDVSVPADVLSAFREQIRATLELTEPTDNVEAQIERLATWLGVAATNAATLDAFDASEDDGTVLVWQTMRDDDVRTSHRRVQGQRRPLGEPFDVGGFLLNYPGQPVGPPEIWISCRCSLRRRSTQEEAVTATATTEQGEALTAAAGETPWHAVLAPEGEWSGDGRRFLAEGLTNRVLPLSLLWQRETGEGHENSIVVGRIDSIYRDGGLIRASGVFRDTEEADEVIGMIAGGFLRGVSVDVDRAQMELVNDGDQEGVDITGRIAAATLVPIPAFQEAFVALGPDPFANNDYQEDSENGNSECPEGQHMMPDGTCMDDDEMSSGTTRFAITDREWDGDSARFTPEQWRDSTILHRAPEEGQDPLTKSLHSLPIREPNGDLNRNAVHAAAARINQVTDATDEEIAAAKRRLRGAYEELNEDPPEVIQASQKFQRGPGWVTHPEETRRLHNYWTRGPGAAEIGWGAPGDFNRCRRALAEYIEPRHLNSTCAQWHHDALGYWPGQHNGEESSLNKGRSMSLLASAAEKTPPTGWFGDQKLNAPTPLTITDCGHVYGHLALWGTCHIGVQGECMTPPPSASNYAYFATGMRRTSEGDVPVGQITIGTGHAKDGLSPAATLAHYDNTGTAVADVVAGEDKHGIWVSGATRDINEDVVDTLRAATLSGDWRRIRGSYELVGALGVNVPGFPVPRTRAGFEAGEQVSLVAAGVIQPAAGQKPEGMTPQQMYRSLELIEDRERRREELAQRMRVLRVEELSAQMGR